jgi:hypothetical protein
MDLGSGGGEMASQVDYSDFEYQFITSEIKLNIDDGLFQVSTEPLGQIGGLSNNEVAELVYHEVQISVEPEDEVADQDVATAIDLRALFGANLPDTGGKQIFNQGIEANSPSQNAQGFVEDRVFQACQDRGVFPFDDEASGPGGGSLSGPNVYEKHWRDITGRGPVLDQNDDIGFSGRLIVGDIVDDAACRATLTAQMIWDVAEVSDAGRAFSIPGPN